MCFAGDASNCKQITSASSLRNIQWHTQTCTLGFNVIGKYFLNYICLNKIIFIDILKILNYLQYISIQNVIYIFFDESWLIKYHTLFFCVGIWPEGADGTDINYCSRSRDNQMLCSGDDFGKVHLFKYPVVQPQVIFNIFLSF